ncbi:hypothetical protein LNP25_23915 [Klebsiella variicola subsp. variicola]|nr:hypothetical protein [Klebsiella variicola subsp. variicola]
MIGNTAPQDITGHPAMTLPCGLVDGLPVGMMLVGRHFAESTFIRPPPHLKLPRLADVLTLNHREP